MCSSSSAPKCRWQRLPVAAALLPLLLALALPQVSLAQQVAQSQYPALKSILSAWSPLVPAMNATWLNGSLPCASWFGLKCDALGQVTSL